MKVGYSSSYDDGILIQIQAFDTEEETAGNCIGL